MQPPDHAAVHWDLFVAAITVALGFVGAAIASNRVGRVLLWAGGYGSVIVAYFTWAAATAMSLLQTLAIALVFTSLVVALAWSPVRRYLREDDARPAVPLQPETTHHAPATNPRIEEALKRAVERDAEQFRETVATGHIPPPDPMREHVRALLDESALAPPTRSLPVDLARFATIAYDTASRWSNATTTQPVRMKYGDGTQFGLSRGPMAATMARNGDRVDVEIGTLDHRTPFKTVPLTERDAEEIGKEIGMRMRA